MSQCIGVPYPTINTMLSKKEEVKDDFIAARFSSKQTRLQDERSFELENALKTWFQSKVLVGIHITINLMQEKALELTAKMNLTAGFKVSQCWFRGLKDRHSITGRTICGKSNAVDNPSKIKNFLN